MRQLLIHNMRLLPSDHDLMQLTLDDVRLLQTRLQQELSKLLNVYFKFNLFFFFYLLNFMFRLNKRN
jgi:hypothetical protein